MLNREVQETRELAGEVIREHRTDRQKKKKTIEHVMITALCSITFSVTAQIYKVITFPITFPIHITYDSTVETIGNIGGELFNTFILSVFDKNKKRDTSSKEQNNSAQKPQKTETHHHHYTIVDPNINYSEKNKYQTESKDLSDSFSFEQENNLENSQWVEIPNEDFFNDRTPIKLSKKENNLENSQWIEIPSEDFFNRKLLPENANQSIAK